MSSWNEKKIRKVKYSLFGERSKRCYVRSKNGDEIYFRSKELKEIKKLLKRDNLILDEKYSDSYFEYIKENWNDEVINYKFVEINYFSCNEREIRVIYIEVELYSDDE